MEFIKKNLATIIVMVVGYPVSGLVGWLIYRPGERLDSVAIGLLVSLITTVLGVMVETNKNHSKILTTIGENRDKSLVETNDNHAELLSAINKHQEGVLDACGISRYLNQDTNLSAAFHKLPGYYMAAISNSSDKIFGERAHTALETCVDTFAELANGRVKVAEEERLHYMYSRIDETSDGLIKVVTWLSRGTSETDWWKRAGKQYLQKQENAIRNRNVEITRVIITSNQTAADLRHLISPQKDIGIKVFTIREDDLHNQDLKVNLLICKDCWVTESDSNVHGISKGGIVSTNYDIDVRPRMRIWDLLCIQPALIEIQDVEKDIE
ncbi:MAG TPA: hypothetical protein VK582_03180 [Pyrinomonadaceae bacterium]|nr:hypothetical protein [Pyrinomonadaceae bacterium]